MSVSAGIVGLPNVGKSTLFNALTQAGAQSENYPFCTIDPNIGVVAVPDPRLKQIQSFIPTDRVIPASVEIVDIAGLVRGASNNEGLGNKFLANIREVDAILHVVRCFDHSDVVHVEGRVDPIDDIEIIDTELVLADMATITKRYEKATRAARGNDEQERARVKVLERFKIALEAGEPARSVPATPEELALIKDSHLLTIKPLLYVANVGEEDLGGGNEHVERVRAHAEATGARVVMICGALESELAELEEEEQADLLAEYGIEEPALNLLVRETYALLGLQSYFTAGVKEIRAWTIPVGATAPQAAGVIHSDFERRFIRAEVYTVGDLNTHQNEAAIRDAGKLRVEGKEYVVQDGDILHIRHNA